MFVRRPLALAARAAVATILLALASAVPAQDQSSEAPVVGRWIGSYGLESPEDVPVFHDAGFNLAILEVPLSFGTVEDDDDELLAVLDACLQAGVACWVGIRISGVPGEGPASMCPYDNAFREELGTAVFRLTRAVAAHPAVVGWVTPSLTSEMVGARPNDFARFLAERYGGDLRALSRAWGRACGDWVDATEALAWESSRKSPLGLNQPIMDVAAFRWRVHMDLMQLFLSTYGAYDPIGLPVFAGQENTYWALANVPIGYEGAITGVFPPWGGAPDLTQCAVAIDVARAGGVRRAFFGIDLHAAVTAEELRRYLSAAWVRGAWGVVFSDWHGVAASEEMEKVLNEGRADATRLWDYEPRPTTALLYEPIHGGVLSDSRTPLYGLLDLPGWPSEPMAALRLYGNGHRWGGMDVIPAHLVTPDLLAQYRTILAPQLYDAPDELVGTLWDWVRAGGVLYCDMGIGSWQSGSFQALTEPLIALLGVLRIGLIGPGEFDGRVYMESPALPSLHEGMSTEGTPFRGLVGDARVTAGAKPMIVFRSRRDRNRNDQLMYSGIMVNELGSGAVVFSTTPCLDDWSPSESLGRLFWGDLLSRDARIEKAAPDSIVGGRLDARAGHGMAVVANYAPGTEPVHLVLYDAVGAVLTDCLVHTGQSVRETEILSAVPGNGLLAARDLPLEVLSPEALVVVHEYGPKGLSLTIGPPDAAHGFVVTRGGWIEGGTPTRYAMRLGSGELPILPNEEFDLILTVPGDVVIRRVASADGSGVVNIPIDTAPAIEVTLRPQTAREVGQP